MLKLSVEGLKLVFVCKNDSLLRLKLEGVGSAHTCFGAQARRPGFSDVSAVGRDARVAPPRGRDTTKISNMEILARLRAPRSKLP